MSPERQAHIQRWIFRIAGFFVLASMALGHYVHPYFYFFTAFVGLNLFQFSFTGFCPMAMILEKAGVGSDK